jgi:hypothetical protein
MIFKKLMLMVSIMLLSSTVVMAEDDANTAGSSGSSTKEALEKIVLEDFEEAEDWRARSTTPLGETKLVKMVQRGLIKDVFDEKSVPMVKDDKGQFAPVSKEQQERINKNHILGVKTYFANRGFDRVEVSPPHEYIIKGKARQVSVWVLGRKYNHTLYVKLRDYKGNLHNVRLGKLDFFGWRKLTASVPGFIPQSSRHSLQDKNLHFVSLYVTSDTHEVGGDFYFYLDDLEVRTDKSEMIYPGYEIKDNW